MYSEFMGKNYERKIRAKFKLNSTVLPNEMINAQLNIGTMGQIIGAKLEDLETKGIYIDNSKKQKLVEDMAIHALCMVLCGPLKSRTSVDPLNEKENQKKWKQRQLNYSKKVNDRYLELRMMG